MPKTTARTIDDLLADGAWDAARSRIEAELARKPGDHWLLTQLGVTHYEQRRYRDALAPLAKSLELVPDCPLTLWNVAGVLDALGKPEAAVRIYTWLLRSKTTADDDPCWESPEWADALRTDCVYRIAGCLRHMGHADAAARCYQQYINLRLGGAGGTYPVEDAARYVRELRGDEQPRLRKESRAVIDSAVQDAGIPSLRGGRRKLPSLSLPELLAP